MAMKQEQERPAVPARNRGGETVETGNGQRIFLRADQRRVEFVSAETIGKVVVSRDAIPDLIAALERLRA